MEESRAQMPTIEDPRHPSYVKYALADILIIIMCGVLCGLDTLGDLVVYAKSKKALQILSAYVTDSGITLAQEAIHEKTNEIPVFQEMLTYLDVESKVVTTDAMHCQRETSRRIVQKKEDYLFGLKENQPSLLSDVRLFFEDNIHRDQWESCQTAEQNAGRIKKRICRKATDISWLEVHKWPRLRSVFAIERITEDHGHHSEETSYYISSWDACPRSLMDLARERWKIESMHWMLDVTFSEYSCRFLSENAQKTLNSLRKFALALHKHFLSASHKNSSIKASLLSALLRSEYLCDVLRFL